MVTTSQRIAALFLRRKIRGTLVALAVGISLLLMAVACGYENRIVRGRDGNDGAPGKSVTGPSGAQGDTGKDSAPCSVSHSGLVSCPDGSSYQIPPPEKGDKGDSVQGEKGDQGNRGQDGQSVIGPQGVPGQDGQSITGPQGDRGPAGQDGQDATSSPFDIVSIIDICETDSRQSTWDEVLLRLRNGQILGHYSDGTKQHLVILTPGSYYSTDGYTCTFTVNQDLSITPGA